MACLRVRLHRCSAHEAIERRYVLYVDWAHVDRLSSELCVDRAMLLLVSATLNWCKLEGMREGEPGGEPGRELGGALGGEPRREAYMRHGPRAPTMAPSGPGSGSCELFDGEHGEMTQIPFLGGFELRKNVRLANVGRPDLQGIDNVGGR